MIRVVWWVAVLQLMCAGAAQAELRVVVTVKPLHSLVAGVMKGIATPHLIVKGAANPHAYALKPSDAAALQNADLIVRVGSSFERFLEPVLKSGGASAQVVSLGEIDGLRRLAIRTGAAWGGGHHGTGHGGAGHDGVRHDGAGHDHNLSHDQFDPHLWLAPQNALGVVDEVAQTLARLAPDKRLELARNAADMAARIKAMERAVAGELAPLKGQPFMVFHDAYQYFESAFGLSAVGAVSLGEGRLPGAKRVRQLRRAIVRRNVVCVFTEPQFKPKIVDTVIEGTTVRRGVLDAIGADIEAGPDAYLVLMRRNAKAAVACLQ